ncbi:MAG: hypothetical protein HY809_08605 [Nitrospirae bacterium]|nr:hypothetical protein [Nitrospirota bacterium]
MNNGRKYLLSRPLITFILAVSIALTAFLAYRDMLGYFFTTPEIFLFILLNKVRSFGDIIRIVTEPLQPGSAFYRPVLSLTYSLDYYLWGLSPFGYHLTELILHVSISISLFFLMLFLKCGRITAWLGAIIFCAHPITVLSVVETTRSHDVLAAFFMLLSLLSAIKYFSAANHNKNLLAASLFLYILALGSKEIAIVLPPAVFAYLMIIHFADETVIKKRLAGSLKLCIPFLSVTIIFLIIRTYVISGAKGYPSAFNNSLGMLHILKSQLKIATDYFKDLSYPIHYLDSLSPVFKDTAFIYMTIAAVLFLVILCLYKAWREQSAGNNYCLSKVIRESYTGIKRSIMNSDEGKALIFLFACLMLPLLIYMISSVYSKRRMYIAAVFFSAILSITTISGFKNRRIALFLLSSCLAISLILYSPLFRSYKEYEYNGNISKTMFMKVEGILPEMPADAVINIYNLPGRIFYHGEIPPVKAIFCVDPDTLKDWLDIKYPGNSYKVIVHSTRSLDIYERDLGSEIQLEMNTDRNNGILNLIFPILSR